MEKKTGEKIPLINSDGSTTVYGHYDSDSYDTSQSHKHFQVYGTVPKELKSNCQFQQSDSEPSFSSADEGIRSYHRYGSKNHQDTMMPVDFYDSDFMPSSAEEGNENNGIIQFHERRQQQDSNTPITQSTRPFSRLSAERTDHNIKTGNFSDDDNAKRNYAQNKLNLANDDSSGDEFDNFKIFHNLIKSGRQRKKSAVRSRGGEFMMKRKKRRVYFCCLGSDIDVDKLHDLFHNGHMNMYSQMYIDVLHLFENKSTGEVKVQSNLTEMDRDQDNEYNEFTSNIRVRKPRSYSNLSQSSDHRNNVNNAEYEPSSISPSRGYNQVLAQSPQKITPINTAAKLWQLSGREVFIFNFGAVVFWGYPRGEESVLLEKIREYIVKGELSVAEFSRCEDDMAFVVSPTESCITIANDVISCPDEVNIKSRLSVSFAIAQSAVLALFEGRIDNKVEEYKYIPKSLALSGRVKLPSKKLGNMIGDVLSIRHDVNLNTEIMSTPDFFWREDDAVIIYRMTTKYLEMEHRTEVLNTRLNMLRDLLVVLQQQSETVLAVQLEWIVIWLIVISILLEMALVFYPK